MPIVQDPKLLVGIQTGDDAAVYRLADNTALVLTVDFFPPIVDDPFSYGSIAVANSLSDIYAMGGRPLLGLNIVGYPAELSKDVLGEILKGGYAKAQEAGCLIVGGHTVDDPEPKYGLAAVGLVEPGKEITNSGARPGDRLVLTKPLGTGIITTAGKQDAADQAIIDRAIAIMGNLNKAASEIMVKVGVNSCTDITGFGLIGHLGPMMRSSGTGARLYLSKIPVLPGVWDLLSKRIAPGGTLRNLLSADSYVKWRQDSTEEERLLLCDAQTSGGLLMSVPAEHADLLVKELSSAGVETVSVIGEVLARAEPTIEVMA